MTEAALSRAGKAAWRVEGALDFATVPRLWPQVAALLQPGARVKLSLAGVRRTNSAGLVMLVEALDRARRADCRLSFADLPEEMLALARMSRCESLLTGAA